MGLWYTTLSARQRMVNGRRGLGREGGGGKRNDGEREWRSQVQNRWYEEHIIRHKRKREELRKMDPAVLDILR